MLRPALFLSMLTLALAGPAVAQQAAQQAPAQPAKPSDAPPKLETIEPGSDTPVTILPSQPRTQITEKKEGGVVTEADVKAGKSHYKLKPNNSRPGNAQPQTVDGGAARAPTWTILQFDLNKKKKQQGAAASEAASDNASTPAPAAAQPAGSATAK
ncbi:MAG: hypothetical protein ACXU8N_09385 [Telluria sp.]